MKSERKRTKGIGAMTSTTQREGSKMRHAGSRAGARSADPRLAPSWSRGIFQDLDGAQEQLVDGPVRLPRGLQGLLEADDDGQALVLRADAGADLNRFSRALHVRDAVAESLFLSLDARSRGASSAGREIARRLGALALEGVDERHREAVLASTLFVDHADTLAEDGLADFCKLAELRRKGRPTPRLVLGYRSSLPAEVADLRALPWPALTTRPDDVLAMVVETLEDRIDAPQLDQEALAVLRQHDWSGGELELARIVDELMRRFPRAKVAAAEMRLAIDPCSGIPAPDLPLADLEEQQIYRVLDANDWNRTRSAQILGIDVKTLYNKLKRYESRKRRLERSRQVD